MNTSRTTKASSPPRWRSEYPFASRYANVGGTRVHYVDEGQGRPVLCVHGNPTWSFHWRKLISRFSADHRVVALDHVGCGLSDRPANYDYGLKQHTSNLVEFIDQLDLTQITLVAHDWGGAIGLGAMRLRRDRFHSCLLLNTGAFPPPRIPLRIAACKVPLVGRLAVQGFNLFTLAALRMAVARPECLSTAARHGILAPYDSWRKREAIYRFVKDIPIRRSDLTWQELAQTEAALPELGRRFPFAFVWGMKDWCFTPDCLDKFVDLIPSARVYRLDDVGHWVMEEAGQAVISALSEFVAPTVAPTVTTPTR